MSDNAQWQTICRTEDLIEHSGVCALLDNEQQIAIFKVNDEEVYSIGNWDPLGEANVLYRGIIGDTAGELFVASPLYKQRYALQSGRCLDDDDVTIPAFKTRIVDELVQIQR